MTAGPLEFDNSKPTVIKRSELEEMFKRYGGRKEPPEEAETKAAEE